MPQLLSKPLTLKNGTVIKNRIFKSAMSEALGTTDNHMTPQLVNLYDRWAKGGTGLLISGNVMIDRRALGEPNNLVDRKSTRLNSSHVRISYAVFCLKKKKQD